MLSFLYRLVRAFRQEHGYSPNVVVMNTQHYRRLLDNVPEMADYGSVSRFLMMEIILSEESMHPHVGWMTQAQRKSSAC
ncbi:MAG TPA: hypothetical protein VJ437_11465 [Acidiferrobacterales bacterium]|nr:hypothetical protein [Acidiferrobacterales bacterium]